MHQASQHATGAALRQRIDGSGGGYYDRRVTLDVVYCPSAPGGLWLELTLRITVDLNLYSGAQSITVEAEAFRPTRASETWIDLDAASPGLAADIRKWIETDPDIQSRIDAAFTEEAVA